ncbi:TPA: hypothetical protein ACYLN4_000726 [Burkholderia lata]
MKTLVLYYCRLRRAPRLVRVLAAIAVLLVAVLVKEALRPVWFHLGLSVFVMDFVVTMVEFPVVAFFVYAAFRGLPLSSGASGKRALHAGGYYEPNPFSMRPSDDLRIDSGVGEPWVDTRVGDDLNH